MKWVYVVFASITFSGLKVRIEFRSMSYHRIDIRFDRYDFGKEMKGTSKIERKFRYVLVRLKNRRKMSALNSPTRKSYICNNGEHVPFSRFVVFFWT